MKISTKKSIFSKLKNHCHFSKEHDFLEITEWTNKEGFDIYLESDHVGRLSMTWGEFKLLKKLVKKLEGDSEEDRAEINTSTPDLLNPNQLVNPPVNTTNPYNPPYTVTCTNNVTND